MCSANYCTFTTIYNVVRNVILIRTIFSRGGKGNWITICHLRRQNDNFERYYNMFVIKLNFVLSIDRKRSICQKAFATRNKLHKIRY